MFERYTENARRVIFFARYEAGQLGANAITPDHLLLGMLRENNPGLSPLLDAAASQKIAEEIRARRTGPTISTAMDMPLADAGKRVLAFAAEEAERVSDAKIRSQYLLLGILREGTSDAAYLLQKFGVTIDSARAWADKANAAEAEQQTSPTWLSLGLPAGYGSPSMLFNAATEMVILHVRSRAGILPTSRLFLRRKDSSCYEPIVIRDGSFSCDSPVTTDSKPVLAFNTLRCEKTQTARKGEDVAYYWRAIEIFDLNTLTSVRSITRSDLILPPSYVDCCVARLVGLSREASILHLVAGLTQNSDTARQTSYFVASLNLRSSKLEIITPLKGITY
jgi:hypothetical protein